ncbi:HopJ type III effector protein [Pedobacter psychrophilus]|uniref:HopJ type III effector protein n=1 Tax=Pedobacter psychrophilus TaxID=1826909 RepID=A0A179DI39_9SPHI|nr:HopJ type III effector protein [Pedobacter psychrophilus]OAQ40380.1 HopJ type III effector protein [Pedobacter psychrophilus]
MKPKIQTLLKNFKDNQTQFSEVISFIDENYNHTATAFKNGDAFNEPSQNQGSAKVFTFAKMNGLTKEDTLSLFAEHYQSVLNTPNDIDHQNIRQFMESGWEGIEFEGEALVAK